MGKKRKKRGACTYGSRDVNLRKLGFESYHEYLKSDLWACIRKRAFAKLGTTCFLCPAQAHCIHHLAYNQGVLRGSYFNHLAPLCKRCHEDVEFDSNGNKRTLAEAIETYYTLLKRYRSST